MILSILTVLFCFGSWAKPTILISYFDAFGGSRSNNSSFIAQELAKKFNGNDDHEIRLCALNTVFDKSFIQIQDCINQHSEPPLMILGLGEAICDLKVETIARNKDKSFGPDNEGNERNGPIIKGAEEYIGLRYPLHEMYCALSDQERDSIVVSNDAGSFVCNNLIYQMGHHYPNLQFGFIHVPAHNCEGLEIKNLKIIDQLKKMLKGVVEASNKPVRSINLPHWDNHYRLPITKHEIKKLKQQSIMDECLREFTGKLKSPEIWSWFKNLKHHN